MPRRWAAASACVLLLAAGCQRGEASQSATTTVAPATTTSTAAAAGGYAPSVLLGRIDDRAIDESSGLVASRRNPGLLWTHNDSGDDPDLYCIDLEARTCGVWRVTGAEAFDWEDIAIGPGPRPGDPYLYAGDIGDNIDQRAQIVVYRVPEPVAGSAGPVPVPTKAAPAATVPGEALRLRYPDGPHNAEALLVHPVTGDLYVVSNEDGGANVYKASAPVNPAAVTTLARVATLHLGPSELATGGDISPDGLRVALCTYTRGYELQVPAGGGFDGVWSQPAAPVDLGFRLQGESIAYRLDGKALLATSEIYPSPLLQVERR